jgi:hypothetical protein
MSLVIYCADIGSVKRRKFGWARLAADEPSAICTRGCGIRAFADFISTDLSAGAGVAAGFECPLFIPLPEDPMELTSARPGDGDRAWSAAAGATSLATGLSETLWILDRAKRRTTGSPVVSADWQRFREADAGLFIWEAFVTKAAKSDTHPGDAETAVLSFRDSLPDPEQANAVMCESRVRSLYGAALLQSGWVQNLAWLRQPCVVMRAQPRGRAG